MSKTNLRQYCLCPTSTPTHTPTLTPESSGANTQELIPFEAAGNYLIAHPEYQLCNLATLSSIPALAPPPRFPSTSAPASFSTPSAAPASPEDIRAQLLQQGIPFRQSNKCSMFCCCACTNYKCMHRCPQDVLHRINLICAGFSSALKYSNSNSNSNMPQYLCRKYIFEEFTSEHPRYFVLYATLQDYLRIRNSKFGCTGERPDKLVYSPMFETEIVTKSHNKDGEQIVRKVVDPKTGYAKILNWPQSGVCPFCLPSGTLMRNRIEGRGDRKSKNWKEKFYENEY